MLQPNHRKPPKKKAAAEKKKKAELKKKVATAYKDPFFLNDFSYLSNPNYNGHNLGEGTSNFPSAIKANWISVVSTD